MSQPKFTMIRAERLGQPVLILVDTALDRERDCKMFQSLLTVRVAMRNPNQLGLCDQAESSRLDQLEDEFLSALDETEYRYVGHVTGNGNREILFYVRNADATIGKLHTVLSQHPDSPVEFVPSHDPAWGYYNQFPK